MQSKGVIFTLEALLAFITLISLLVNFYSVPSNESFSSLHILQKQHDLVIIWLRTNQFQDKFIKNADSDIKKDVGLIFGPNVCWQLYEKDNVLSGGDCAGKNNVSIVETKYYDVDYDRFEDLKLVIRY